MGKWRKSDLKGLKVDEPFTLKSTNGEKIKGDPFFLQLCREWGLKPIVEYQFAKDLGRKWRTDYYFESDDGVRVALEVEGGIYEQKNKGKAGGHTSIEGFKSNIEKYNNYAVKGILLYRVLPEDLYKTKIFEDLKLILKNGRK